MKKQFVPLRVWWVALGMVCLVLIVFSSGSIENWKTFLQNKERIRKEFKLNLEKLLEEHINDTNENEQVVIFLGSSLTGHAVEEATFETQKLKSKNIKIYKIWYRGMSVDDLRNIDLFDQLKKFNPALICIEDQVFLYEIRNISHSYSFNNILNVYRSNILSFREVILPNYFTVSKKKQTRHKAFDYLNPDHYTTISRKDSTNYKKNLSRDKKYRDIRAFEYLHLLNQKLIELRSQDISIIITHLPRASKVEEKILSKSELRKRDVLLKEYNKLLDIHYWHFPSPLPFEYYWDVSHLNWKGRTIYSEWLYQKIDAHFK